MIEYEYEAFANFSEVDSPYKEQNNNKNDNSKIISDWSVPAPRICYSSIHFTIIHDIWKIFIS